MAGAQPVSTMARLQYSVEELHKNNWWVAGARLRGGMDVVGTNPEGELISNYPEKLPLPKAVWVTKWGMSVDGWVLLGWGVAYKTNLDRLGNWVSAWVAEREDLKPAIMELLDELEYRMEHLNDEASTREPRAFFFT